MEKKEYQKPELAVHEDLLILTGQSMDGPSGIDD